MYRFFAALLLASFALPALAQEKDKYPRINVATIFEVDAKWPSRPDDLPWAAMTGIAIDPQDNVFLLTRTSKPVQMFDPTGKFLRSWGHPELITPHQIRRDSAGNFWITDIAAHQVMKFSPDGKLLQALGQREKAGRDAKHFYMPTDVAISSAGDVYVSDGYGNARIVQFDKAGQFVRDWGELGAAPGQFSIPHSIAVDSKGKVYVADRNNSRIQVFSGDGKFLDQWNNLMIPWGLTMTKNDELWACGSSPMQWRKDDTNLGCPPKDQIVIKFDTTGKILHLASFPKGLTGLERPGELNWVHCIALDSKGNLYMGDIYGKRAQKFDRHMPQR